MTMPNDEDTIRKAADLIRVGRREDSRLLQARYLQANPDSVDAWMLMSMCIRDRQQQVDCLRQVIRIHPDHSLAQSRLVKLLSGTGTVTTWPALPGELPATPPFTAGALPDAKPQLAHTPPSPPPP